MNDSNYSNFGLFKIVIILLIVVSFYNLLQGRNVSDFSFQSLLDVFSNVPQVDVSWSYADLTIYSDWGDFNFFREFINLSISIIEFLLFLIGCLWQGLNFIFYFLQNLFSIGVSVVPGAGPSFGGR